MEAAIDEYKLLERLSSTRQCEVFKWYVCRVGASRRRRERHAWPGLAARPAWSPAHS